MPNLLKVAMVETVLSLRQRGWSQRRIARELGIDRETVARHLRQVAARANPANAPPGFRASDESANPANAPLGASLPPNEGSAESGADPPPAAHAGRTSDCASWQTVIQAKLDLGLSAQRIYQDLVADHGFIGSYYRVRRFVRRLEATQELPFRRLECGPGEEAQVDFGSGAPIVLPDGKRRRTHVFRSVLAHSRKG